VPAGTSGNGPAANGCTHPVNLHPVLTQVFRRWTESSVRWALLRVPENPSAPEGDIDILLAPEAARVATDIAVALGFVPVPGYAPDTHMLQFHPETRHWLWLHCTVQVSFGPYGAVHTGAEVCLGHRIVEGPLTRLTPNHEFWTTLMHALLDQRRLSEASRRRLQSSAGAALPVGPLPDSLRPVLPPGWTPEQVLKRAQAQDWPSLIQLAPEMWARALRRGRPALVRRLTRAAARVFRTGPAPFRRRGLSVAVLGPDGAGKSTLAEGLEREFVFPVTRVYMGLTGGWLRHVDRLRIPGIVRIGRLSIIWSRYLRARYRVLRGDLVVFDRYIFDAAVPPPNPLGPLRRLGRWIDGHSCPAPDLLLILDAPGQLMYARKGAYTVDLLEEWRHRFRTIANGHHRSVVLDASRPMEHVLGEAVRHIWAQYSNQWGRG